MTNCLIFNFMKRLALIIIVFVIIIYFQYQAIQKEVNEFQILQFKNPDKDMVEKILLEKKKKKPGPKPKKKSKSKSKTKGKDIKTGNLSKSTVKKITNIANKRGYTVGSMKKEYVLGLRAWAAGHPPGVSQHQWATARINKATPGKSWSVVKKSKSKKK